MTPRLLLGRCVRCGEVFSGDAPEIAWMDEPELGWADESGPPASPLLASIAREFLPHGVVYGLNDLETHVLLADHHVFWPIETEDA